MGIEFWEENLTAAIESGKYIGKTECEVKQEVSYALVSIYTELEAYDKAYDFLVEQATGYPWISDYYAKRIIEKVRYCDRLKSAIDLRLSQGDLTPENSIEFKKNKSVVSFK